MLPVPVLNTRPLRSVRTCMPNAPPRRAKNIQNEAHVNEDVDQRTLLRKVRQCMGGGVVGSASLVG